MNIARKLLISSLLLAPVISMAGGTGTNVSSSSFASTNSMASSQNAGNAQNITFNSPGTSTIKSTGTAVMPGFSGSFSSDYCSGTVGAAAGGVGFAVSAGAPKTEQSCVMLRVFERTQQAAASVESSDPDQSKQLRMVSLEVLAETDPKVKEIFQKRGLIPKDPEPVTNKNNNLNSFPAQIIGG